MENQSSNNTIQTFWVLIGSLSAFAFTMVSSMLLSRYFTKEDYGTYKQVMYVYSTLLVVFTLGLPRAYSYYLPRVTKGQAKDLITKLNYLLLLMGLIMSICLFFGATFIANALKNKELTTPIKYFSLVPLFMLPTMGVDGVLATYKKAQLLAIYKLCSQIFILCAVVLPVILFKGDINNAIIGFTISSFLCFIFAMLLKYKPIKEYKKDKSPYSYKEIFKYTIPIIGATIWGVVIAATDQFFISRYFGSNVFADFSNGSLELPFVGMIISSTTIVLSPIFSKYAVNINDESKKEIILLWQSVINKTVKLIYPFVIFCFCFADIIMTFLYGQKYIDSGVYFQIKIIVNFFTIITYGPLLLSIGGEKFYYRVHMYGAIILVILEWLAIKLFDSPYLITVISVVCQIGRILFMLNYIAKFFNVKLFSLIPLRLIANILIPSILILYIIRYLLINNFSLNNLEILIYSFLIYISFFISWTLYRKIDYISIIKPLLKKILRIQK